MLAEIDWKFWGLIAFVALVGGWVFGSMILSSIIERRRRCIRCKAGNLADHGVVHLSFEDGHGGFCELKRCPECGLVQREPCRGEQGWQPHDDNFIGGGTFDTPKPADSQAGLESR